MLKKLDDLSHTEMAHEIVNNMIEYFKHYKRNNQRSLIKDQVIDIEDAGETGLLSSSSNAVISSKLVSHDRQEKLLDYKTCYLPVPWWENSSAEIVNLEGHFSSYDFTHVGSLAGMAVDLNDIDKDLPGLSGFSVKEVSDIETLKIWNKLAVKEFRIPDSYEQESFELFHHTGFNPNVSYFIGMLNNKPVATSLIYYGASVVGIYWVSTLSEVRGKLIGTAMAQAPLFSARERGYNICVLHSSGMGYGIYSRLKFKEYCKLNIYLMKK